MRHEQQNFKRKCVIAVDIDGSLVSKDGSLNHMILDYIKDRKKDGFTLILWSARGREYALGMVEKHKLQGVFDSIISKPDYIIDDKAWSWTQYTKLIDIREIVEYARQKRLS